jgi:hypothetical protein
MNYYIYEIECYHPNYKGMKYIGKRQCECEPINDDYWGSGRRMNKKIVNEIGHEYFSKKIIVLCDNPKQLVEQEIYLHEVHDVGRNPKYFNIVKQTSTGFDRTGIPQSQDIRKKISNSTKGEKNHFYRKKHQNSSKKLISDANKGNVAWNKGKKMTAEYCKNISIGAKNRDNSAHCKKVICLETGIIYESAKSRSLELGMSKMTITSSIRNNHRCKGFTYKYLEDV